MEDDLISRSALLSALDELYMAALHKTAHSVETIYELDHLAMLVKEAPTIGAVEVVRCRDCEEYIPWLEGDYICGRIGSYFGNTKPNDFCSRGVRKTDMEVVNDQA